MVKNFYLNINIIDCDIVREKDGLAYSSRNIYLSEVERYESLKISRSLKTAAKMVGINEVSVSKLIKEMKLILDSDKIELEYICITNREFKSIENIEVKNSIILVAARVGKTRLIDNIWI